jgi:dTDP-4-amino-4,6-dideoxygalactose transaminase
MNIKIPCLDLSIQHKNLKKEIFEAFEKVYDSTSFAGGPYVEQFENEFADFIGAEYAIGVSNGTTALHLAMLALGIGQGDEVIIPANTFIATAWGVSHAGAKPVFVDCDNSWNIDVTQIEKAITKNTKAIIGVHLYGQPFDIEGVRKICDKYKLFLVEDAAQAQGAKINNSRVGKFGDIACFSFYPGKNLGACGEAGGLTTNSKIYAEKIKSLRNHGSKIRYYHDEIGFNYRMGGLEAASLSVKLKYLEGWNNRRIQISSRYRTEINNSLFKMQFKPQWAESVNHLFVITTPDKEALVNYLIKNGITPGFHYPVPCHLQNAYKFLGHKIGDFPNSEFLAENCISLPMFPEMSEENVDYVIRCMNSYKI